MVPKVRFCAIAFTICQAARLVNFVEKTEEIRGLAVNIWMY
jgi:hypothetical protein